MGKRPTADPAIAPTTLAELRERAGEYTDCATAGAYLGVHAKTIRRRITDGTIQGIRIGHAIRVRVADLEKLRVPVTGA
jgi:excisionase family DNA binding protein